ncbi:dihydrofolate reductase [Methylocaldum szegediense]|uniref:dihydrofolate reductase n=1 Tax=Methylocaldum szegediense TaxID=73780 RepID=UPI00040D63D9|nr:dihydrofolate reductase [Methylocaldum szegediense]
MTMPLLPRLPSNRSEGCLTLIAAVAKNGVIGRGDDLPWSIAEELRIFRLLTLGHTLIMGRKSAEILYRKTNGRGLDQRQIFVMSQKGWGLSDPQNAAFRTFPSTNFSAREIAHLAKSQPKRIFVAGGREIYQVFLPYVDEMVISFIRDPYEGNVYFPPFDAKEWDWDKDVVIAQHSKFVTRLFNRRKSCLNSQNCHTPSSPKPSAFRV